MKYAQKLLPSPAGGGCCVFERVDGRKRDDGLRQIDTGKKRKYDDSRTSCALCENTTLRISLSSWLLYLLLNKGLKKLIFKGFPDNIFFIKECVMDGNRQEAHIAG